MLTLGQKLTALSAVFVVNLSLVLVGGFFFVFPAAVASLPFVVAVASG